MAEVLKKYKKADGSAPVIPVKLTPKPSTSPAKKVAEKPKPVVKNTAAVPDQKQVTVTPAKITPKPVAKDDEPLYKEESIAQTTSGSSEGELMTNSADKQEVDNDTNESSNLEKQIEAQAKAIEEK